MKAPVAFGIGLAGGAIIASTLLFISSSHDRPASGPNNRSVDQTRSESEIVALRHVLSEFQKAAQSDREALRVALQEIRVALHDAAQNKLASSVATTAVPTDASSSSAITSYLGTPVPAPANLDRKYSPDELAAVFRDLTETLGIKVEKLAVDATEFPFVIHGRIESAAGAGYFKKIDSALRALPGYTYGGSVTGGGKDGSTYFALNMTPSRAYPKEHADAIGRRMMLRLQIAAAAAKEANP